jgi:hypothetical protein
MEETCERFRKMKSMQALYQDFRLTARGMRKSPAFTIVAISSLPLGIGANTAIFSFVNAILLRRLPVAEPTRLVQLHEFAGNKNVSDGFSDAFIHELAARNQTFDGLLGRFPVRVNLMSAGVAEPLRGEVVTGQYFTTLGIHPALGRLLTEEDIRAAAGNPVCVLSYSTWQERFGGDPSIASVSRHRRHPKRLSRGAASIQNRNPAARLPYRRLHGRPLLRI